MKIFVPPIKCQGIKTKLVPWILENAVLPEEGLWIEPFMGSGVVGFNARPMRAIFSDINPHIISFYHALKTGKITPEMTREFLESEGQKLRERGEDYYYEVRERFNTAKNPLDFLFLSRSGFNGVIRFNSKGFLNVPFCRKPERFSRAYVTKIVNQIRYVYQTIQCSDWSFECRDFADLISQAQEQDFIYCDPPYFGRHVDYFNSWSAEDEHKLFLSLKNTKAKFILSTWHSNKYRRNPCIDIYWEQFNILTREHFYHIGAKEENRNPMIEALVTNHTPDIEAPNLADRLPPTIQLERSNKHKVKVGTQLSMLWS